MMKQTLMTAALMSLFALTPALRAATDDATKATLASYENVRAALADDNLAAAKQAAASLAEKSAASKNEAIAKGATNLAKSANIEKAREQFKAISQEVIPLVKGQPGYYVVRCSMANASWVQTDKTVRNPYYGKAMLECGEVLDAASSTGATAPHAQAHGAGHGCCK